jgi:hypothetical protein
MEAFAVIIRVWLVGIKKITHRGSRLYVRFFANGSADRHTLNVLTGI